MADLQSISDLIGLPNHMKILQIDPEFVNSTDDSDVLKSYTVLVNPESYTVVHKICTNNSQEIGAHTSNFHFNKVNASSMNITLLFDSTGSLGQIPILGNESILEQINYFLDVAFVPPENVETPKMLRLIWGKMIFEGVLQTVSINYSHFDPTGDPIRAKATCTFTGGKIKFSQPDDIEKALQKARKATRKITNISKQKHAINSVIKHGSYIKIISQQPKNALPKSLRDLDEVLKMVT